MMTYLIRCCLLFLSVATITACGENDTLIVSGGGGAPSPAVVSTSPTNGKTGVSLTSPISVTFNQAMNPGTITTSTFILSTGNIIVPGSVSISGDGTTASFTTTTGSLAPNTVYTARITTGVRNSAGIPLAVESTWTFSTGTEAIQFPIPLQIVATVPAANAAAVDVMTVVSATFNREINPSTGTSQSFRVSSAQGSVNGTVVINGASATFTPAVALATNTVYTATITTGIKDTAGVGLSATFSWSFTTATTTGTLPPAVTATAPAAGAINVPVTGTAITATFSKAINPATVTQFTFTLSGNGVPVQGTVTMDQSGAVATFTPVAPLVARTLHTATITTGVKDVAGTPLAAPFVWSFTTGT